MKDTKKKKDDPYSPFRYVNAVAVKKENLMRDHDDLAMLIKGYKPWIVNVALSMHPDTILHANMMNMYHELPNRAQFEFYLNSIRAKKRPHVWAKSAGDSDLEAVCQYYKCNYNVGKQYLSIMTSEALQSMKEKLETGGTKT